MNNKTVTLIKFFKSLARLIILIGLIGSIAELSESTTLLYFLEKSYSKPKKSPVISVIRRIENINTPIW